MDRTSLKPNQPDEPVAAATDNGNPKGYSSQAMRSRKKEKSLLTEIVIVNPFSLY